MKKSNHLPPKSEMQNLEHLFKQNNLVLLEKKIRALILSYSKVPVLYNILGVVLQKKKKLNEAISSFTKAISLNSNFDQAYNNLGNVLEETGKFEEAIKNYKKTIEINPNYGPAFSNLGNVLSELGRFQEALINQKQSVELEPNNPEFNNHLGNSLKDLGKHEEAILSYKKAIKLNNNYAEAYSNLGNVLDELGNLEEAISNYQYAIKLNPQYKKANLNESLVWLKLEKFDVGWKKYEMRLGEGTNIDIKYPKTKMWDGKYLDGTLLVWGEQGLGDHIIFASMLLDLTQHAKNIVLEIDERLENLLKRYFEEKNVLNIKIYNDKKTLAGTFDKHIPIGSLGQYLRKSTKSFENTPKKFLVPSSKREKDLKIKLSENNKLKIGISWRTLNKKQKFRNIDLKLMDPIFSNTNCEFIDLQFGEFKSDLQYLRSEKKVNIKSINEIDNYNNIDELASLINCLDLVITIQNTTAHLAGALGKKTWLMLAKNARWHWFRSEEKSIWYPSIKIFRQEEIGNWNTIINNISMELKYLKKHK